MKDKFRKVAVVAGMATLSLGGHPALAQTDVNQTAGAALEEVVVTARRGQESLQAVPVSVQALSTEQLEMRSVVDLAELTRIVPGMRYSAEGGAQNTTISLRGLSKIPIGDGAPAVVTYFSEVPLSSNGTNIPTFDLANVQVLKGPQGTLFGRNTIGGAVLVSPQEPTFTTEGYLKGAFGNHQSRTFEGAVSVPLVADKLAVRVAGQSRQRDGYVENYGPGDDLNDLDQVSFRVSVLWQPNDRVSDLFMWDRFKAEEAGSAQIMIGANPAIFDGLDAQAGAPIFSPFKAALGQVYATQQAWGPFKARLDQPLLVMDRELEGFMNKLNIQLTDNLAFKNILSYRTTEIGVSSDVDGGPTLQADGTAAAIPGAGGATFDRLVMFNPGEVKDSEQLTAEFQLIGQALDNRMDWIAGVFYLKEEPNGPQGTFYQQFQLQSSAIPGLRVPETPAVSVHTETESKSAFGQVGLDLSDWVTPGLKLNLGYRYTEDEIEACGASTLGGTNSLSAPYLSFDECRGLTGPGLGAIETDSNASTWTIGLDYHFGNGSMAYVTSRKGYRSAGVNVPDFNTPNTAILAPYQEVQPEEVIDVEVGLKSDFNVGDMLARVNIAAYTMEYTDAVQFINVTGSIDPTDPALPNSGSFGVNAGDLTIEGVEFEGMLVPTPGLTLTLAAAYTQQEVDEIAGVPAPFTLTENSVTLPTPEWSATAAFQWVLPFKLGAGELTLNGDYFWTDEWQAQGVMLDSYHVSNFRLGWSDERDQWRVGLYVTNATDEEYITAASAVVPVLPFQSAMFGEPRLYGFDVSYRFGN